MIKISLCTPTRNRVDNLNNLLESLVKTTLDRSEIEILLAVDRCDEVMMPLIDSYKKKYNCINIRFFIVNRSEHFSKDYFNFLSLKAEGRWVMAINDDSIFVTEGWNKIIDERMVKAANRFGDDILLGIVKDGKTKADGMSCWVLSSKEYVTLMNGLLIEEVYTWGGDYWISRLFKYVSGGNRKVVISDVCIEHDSHHSNPHRKIQLPQPETFKLFQRIEEEHPCNMSDDILKEKAEKINAYISK